MIHFTKDGLMKKALFLLPLYLLTSLQANIQDDRKEMQRVDTELFIVKKQNVLLKEKYNEEKQKYFNHARIKAYEETMLEYEEKEKKVQTEKNRLMAKKKKYDQYMAQQERRIPSLDGDLHVKIDISDQVMNVYKGDTLVYSWFVSTAADGYFTPTGNFKPYHTVKMHYSKQYENSPMPYSIFFKDGFAIHGTEWVRSLGYKASHGCVRLHPTNANKLYNLVRENGYQRTFISISSR